MDSDIVFEFDGKKYTVSPQAYVLDRIVLPDKRVLFVLSWVEKNPPIPDDLYVRVHNLMDKTPEQIATVFNGVVAKPVED